MSVEAYTGDEDLFGKTASDLQENLVVGTDAITGTLKYIDDYSSAFSGDEAYGNYMAIKATTNIPATITVTITNPSTLDDDGIFVGRIADKDSQTVTVVASADGYDTVTKTFSLTGLTCNPAG